MPRGKELTDSQRARIDVLGELKFSKHEIARVLKKSRTCIINYINKKDEPSGKRTGRPRKLSPQDICEICRYASNRVTDANEIIEVFGLKVCPSTVLRVFGRCDHLVFAKMRRVQHMLPHHEKARVVWCEPKLLWDGQWREWIFSDEKKFNLDSPDGWAYYWHDKRKPELCKPKRQNDGGHVMVWGAVGVNGRYLKFCPGNINSEKYIETLSGPFMQQMPQMCDGFPFFQQDGASIHRSAYSTAWLNENLIWDYVNSRFFVV